MSKLFDNFAVFLTVVLIYVLLIFNETSIMTSLVFYEGQNSYSIYMIEFFGLKISDLFIILLTILTLVYFVKNKFLIHKYYYFIIIYSSYLLIGSIYNLLFYDHIKGFLYDFKVTLYLFVPFLLLLHLNNSKIFQFYFKLEIIFILCLASSIIDSVYIYHNFESEYPSLIGLFVLDDFIIIVIPIIIFLLQKNKLYKIFWFIIIIFLILMDINRGNLGNIYQNTLILFLFSIIFLIFNKSLTSSFIIYFLYFFIFIILPILIIYNLNFITDFKSDGIAVRQEQFNDYIYNFELNFHGFFGSGLGSTYEKIALTRDVYSVGNSMGSIVDGITSKTGFIFNFMSANALYKFGILGNFLLIIGAGYLFMKNKEDNLNLKYHKFATLFYCFAVLPTPGILKDAIIFSILLYLTSSYEKKI